MTTGSESNIKNSKLSIYAPIVLAVVLALGVFIGSRLGSGGDSSGFLFKSDPNKLDFILKLIENEYVDTVKKKDLVEKTIPLLLEQLDPHSVYIPARDLKRVNEPLEGNFDGIGVQFNILNDTLLVVNTVSGGPSEKVGVLPGDKIVTINDSAFVGKGISNDLVISKLKGERGSKVKIGVKRSGYKNLLNFEITRDQIPLYSIDVSYMIDKTIGYIKISAFSRTTYEEFNNAVEKLKMQGMQKMILDLRSNGGGYLDAAINIADEFLKDKELIVYTMGKSRPRTDYRATGKGNFENEKLVVLIDSWSASASEIVAGAIQDNDRGVIVGRRSFGKGLVQEPTMFKDGSAVRLTIARYYTPSGRCIQKSYSNGVQEYDHDLLKRFEHGELENADSVIIEDTIKYHTKNGKIVYGGGGIMPDVFVPADTSGLSAFFREISQKSLIYNYALNYTNQNRDKLNKLGGYREVVKYLEARNVISDFLNYVRKNGIVADKNDLSKSEKLVKTHLYAYICRNIFDNEGFYPVMMQEDNTLKKAIEVLEK
ncbi:MAG: S41 family peptidase [Bacteroidales bacterium]